MEPLDYLKAKVNSSDKANDQDSESIQDISYDLLQRQFAIDQHAILVITNLAGTILYANSLFSEISGYSQEELIGKNHRIINSGYHPKSFFTEMFATLKKGETWKGEIRNRAKNGSFYWVSTTIVPLRNKEGKICQYFASRTDITHRKQIEEELRASHIQLKKQNEQLLLAKEESQRNADFINAIANNIPGMVGYWTADLKCAFANQQYLTWFGKTTEQMQGIHMKELLGEKLFKANKPYILGVLNGEDQRFERTLVKTNGEISYTYAQYITHKQDGNVIGFYVLVLDITELKREQKKLYDSEVRYRALLTNLKAGVVVYAPDTSIIMNNPRSEELLGLNADQMRGNLPIDPEWRFIDSNKNTLPLENYPVNKIRTTSEPIKNNILGINRPNKNDIVWVSVNGLPTFNETGEITEILISFIDITIEKNAETIILENNKFIESLINLHPTIIYIYDIIEERNIFSNDGIEHILGYSKQEIQEMKNEVLPILTHPDDLSYYIENTYPLYLKAKDNEPIIHQYRQKNKKGNWVWLESIEIVYKRLPDGSVSQILGTASDITERKHAESILQNHTKELEILNHTKDKFFNIIAHDLRNPFIGIIGLTEIIEKNLALDLNEESKGILEQIQMISKSSKSAFNLLENLMQWAKTQTGDVSYNPQNISIRYLFSITIPIITGNAFLKNITIEHSDIDDINVYADEFLVTTILRNLLTNAIKFTHSKGIIKIFTIARENFLEISISDSGVGIANSNLEKIFRIDSKFSRPGTENEKGTGLGLILCQEFTKMHGGEIWVQSEVGVGSTFTFTLPLAK